MKFVHQAVASNPIRKDPSHSVALEAFDRTCLLLISRAKFFPARVATGEAATGKYTNSVRWTAVTQYSSLPTSAPAPASAPAPKPASTKNTFSVPKPLAQEGRGLDMAGLHDRAQQAYRAALVAGPNDEVSSSLAISLAITGDAAGMEFTMKPLLANGSKKNLRAYAFALAILGRTSEAIAVAKRSAPDKVADGIAPYLRYMGRLTNPQKANAANFGLFPLARDIGRSDAKAVGDIDIEFNALYEAWLT